MTALGEERRPGQVDDRCGAETQAVVRRQVQRMGDAEVKSSPMIGPVLRFHEIVKQAEEGGFDLIVMNTRGHPGIRRGTLGNVADEVIRSSSVPVLVLSLTAIDKNSESDYQPSTLTIPLAWSSLAKSILPFAHHLENSYPSAYICCGSTPCDP